MQNICPSVSAAALITVDIAHRVNYFRDFGVANTLGVFSYLLVFFTALYYLRSSVRKMAEKP